MNFTKVWLIWRCTTENEDLYAVYSSEAVAFEKIRELNREHGRDYVYSAEPVVVNRKRPEKDILNNRERFE